MPNNVETEAMALAGSMLTYALMGRLVAKGILTEGDRNVIFETTLMSLEGARAATDPATELARKIIDGWAQIAATGTSRPTKPSAS
jgi:hypothetical protein